jgi:hypothetical protein
MGAARAMLSDDEQVFAAEDDDQIDVWMNDERCIMIDWQDGPDVAADFLQGMFRYKEYNYGLDDKERMEFFFRGRRKKLTLKGEYPDAFRVVIALDALLRPDYEIHLLACSAGDDTLFFLVRPQAWWDFFRVNHSEKYARVFRGMDEVRRVTGLMK